jgi:hypothetical protein
MTSRHTNVTESIFHVNWDGHNHRFNGAGHAAIIRTQTPMHFIGFFGNAPTTSRQGTLPFYKNKNRGNLCQNV